MTSGFCCWSLAVNSFSIPCSFDPCPLFLPPLHRSLRFLRSIDAIMSCVFDRRLGVMHSKNAPLRNPSKLFTLNLLIKSFILLIVLGIGFSVLIMYEPQYIDLHSVAMRTISMSWSSQYCADERTSLQRWIAPPSNLTHSMTDEELFWRASFVPQVNKYPYNRISKVAFMFLTKGPLPLAPLWEKFFKGHEGKYSIYVHALPDYQPEFPWWSVFNRRQIPSQVAEWGKMSMCDAERRLLANALLDVDNERFVLLSESCIPLHNFSTVYSYLAHSKHSFVGVFDDPGPHGRGRYNRNMAPEVSIFQWRKGAQWFEVDRNLAVFLIQDTKYYLKFKDFCRPPCYVDEHYFPTMLAIELPHLLANRSLTSVDWSRGGAHPATFGGRDVTEGFLKRLVGRRSCMYNDHPTPVCFLFARKFSPSALKPLLHFAPILLGYGS